MTVSAQPYICPLCCAEPENYYGLLVHPPELAKIDTEPKYCPNHRAEDGTPILVALIPVVR